MIRTHLLLAAASLAYGLLLAGILGRRSRSAGPSRGIARKVFHIGIFTGAAPAQLVLGFWGVVVYGSTVAALVFLSFLRGPESVLYRVLVREEDGVRERRFILLPLLATAFGGLTSAFLVGPFAVVGYLVCGWGDAAGEIVGQRCGRTRYAPPLSSARDGEHTRSLEGSAAVFSVGAGAGWLALLLLGIPLLPAFATGLLVGLVGALAEAFSGHGTDNFWVQLLPSLTAWWLVG